MWAIILSSTRVIIRLESVLPDEAVSHRENTPRARVLEDRPIVTKILCPSCSYITEVERSFCPICGTDLSTSKGLLQPHKRKLLKA